MSSLSKEKIQVKIPNPDWVFNDKYIPFQFGYPETLKPIIVFEGGRGSAKSREIAQFLTRASLENKLRVMLIRKVADTVRDSQYRDVKDVVEDWEIGQAFRFMTSPLGIKNTKGSEFISKGLDKSTKVKSVANVDIIWIEEAEELTKEDWTDLSLSIRGTRGDQLKRIIVSFNRKAGNWTEEEFFFANGQFKTNNDTYHLHTTYLDNKFLDQAFLNRLDRIKEEDYDLWLKNAMGEPIRLEGLVYTNWDVVEAFPDNCSEIIYGCDFGFNDPTVLTKVGRREMDLYLQVKYYENQRTTGDLIELLPEFIHSKTAEIYCDTSEPDRIEEIYRAGYNAQPSERSVIDGIDTCKRFKIHIVADSKAGIKDIESYRWKKDKNGKSLDEPNHSCSHFPDSFRYPVFTHYGKEFRRVTSKDMRAVKLVELSSLKTNGY